MFQSVDDVKIARDLTFSSDHLPLTITYSNHNRKSQLSLANRFSFVEESYPTPHIHEQMTTSNYGYDIAYNFTHNNIMLEPNAMNNIDIVAHMNVHNTQY